MMTLSKAAFFGQFGVFGILDADHHKFETKSFRQKNQRFDHCVGFSFARIDQDLAGRLEIAKAAVAQSVHAAASDPKTV